MNKCMKLQKIMEMFLLGKDLSNKLFWSARKTFRLSGIIGETHSEVKYLYILMELLCVSDLCKIYICA